MSNKNYKNRNYHNYNQYAKKEEPAPVEEKEEVIETVEETAEEVTEAVEAAETAEEVEEVTEAVEAVEEVTEAKAPLYGIVNCARLNIRKGPSTNTDPLCIVEGGSELEIVLHDDEWLKVLTNDGVSGYCMKKFIDEK